MSLSPFPQLHPTLRRFFALTALFTLLGLPFLGTTAPWWDEGWTLTLARTWAENGFYGGFLNGEPAPIGLSASFPTVGLVRLSFALFGVGIWQARLVGVLFTGLALALLYLLTRRLFGPRAALLGPALLLLTSVQPVLHPLTAGAQVLAEPPMLALLLAGYLFLAQALDTPADAAPRPALLLGTALCLGLALVSKGQPLPFVVASLLIAAGAAALGRRWRAALGLIATLGLSLLVQRAFFALLPLLLGRQLLVSEPVAGLLQVTALVLEPGRRLFALQVVAYGLPMIAGLCYGLWRLSGELRAREISGDTIARAALWGLAGSWSAWFILLSLGIARYYYPAYLLSAPFAGWLLADLSRWIAPQALATRLSRPYRAANLALLSGGILLWVCISLLGVVTIGRMAMLVGRDNTTDLQATVAYLESLPAAGPIESYDSELFFLLNRPYHFPPDQVHVTLNQRSFLKQEVADGYDPLRNNPAYLVVGPMSRVWALYTEDVQAGAFEQIRQYGAYTIYRRSTTQP